jgi:hypothetical protein
MIGQINAVALINDKGETSPEREREKCCPSQMVRTVKSHDGCGLGVELVLPPRKPL